MVQCQWRATRHCIRRKLDGDFSEKTITTCMSPEPCCVWLCLSLLSRKAYKRRQLCWCRCVFVRAWVWFSLGTFSHVAYVAHDYYVVHIVKMTPILLSLNIIVYCITNKILPYFEYVYCGELPSPADNSIWTRNDHGN